MYVIKTSDDGKKKHKETEEAHAKLMKQNVAMASETENARMYL